MLQEEHKTCPGDVRDQSEFLNVFYRKALPSCGPNDHFDRLYKKFSQSHEFSSLSIGIFILGHGMGHPTFLSYKTMREILKFDTGKDGFEKMIFVLAVTAIAVLILGIIFIRTTFQGG